MSDNRTNEKLEASGKLVLVGEEDLNGIFESLDTNRAKLLLIIKYLRAAQNNAAAIPNRDVRFMALSLWNIYREMREVRIDRLGE